jgi:hypothetical protein
MSLPGLVAHPLAVAAIASPVDAVLGLFNSNMYFIGLMMLILNLGGRFIPMEISKGQEMFLQHPWVRRGLIFVAIFIATRNLAISFWLTIAVVLCLGYLFNENSSLCILGKGGAPGASCSKDDQGDKKDKKEEPKPGMTPEEMEIFRRLNEKKMRYEQAAEKEKADASKQNKFADPSIVYMANLSLLQGP